MGDYMSSKIIAGNATNLGVVASGATDGILELQTGSTPTTAVTVTTGQKVGVGTTSPSGKLHVSGGSNPQIVFDDASSRTYGIGVTGSAMSFYDVTGAVERMRIDSSGNVIVSGTSTSSNDCTYQNGGVFVSRRASSGGTYHAYFYNGGTEVGSITSNTVATFYNTTSDYRLKENATPVTTGLQTITALNPVNFDWISKNVSDTGFLAHEFQAVIPNSVMGTKDAVDANGKPIYQQIDRSGAIPFLVAAIKELNAKVDAQALEIQALKGNA
jgi:hypothetical protein